MPLEMGVVGLRSMVAAQNLGSIGDMKPMSQRFLSQNLLYNTVSFAALLRLDTAIESNWKGNTFEHFVYGLRGALRSTVRSTGRCFGAAAGVEAPLP